MVADFLSRGKFLPSEWTLNPLIFQKICQVLVPRPEIDLFFVVVFVCFIETKKHINNRIKYEYNNKKEEEKKERKKSSKLFEYSLTTTSIKP